MFVLCRLVIMWTMLMVGGPLFAASSPSYISDRVTARLVTAENGVAPGAGSVSAGLVLTLAEGWHTYWKSPGAVGYPVEILWDGSANLSDTTLFWPAPKRFTAFEIENYGYEKAVTLPLKLDLAEAGQMLVAQAEINLLVCADICVPEVFSLSLVLPEGSAIDRDGAKLIADAMARVPVVEAASDITARASMNETELQIALSSDTPFQDLNVFPDLGLDAAFGPPDIRLSDLGRKAAVRFDILATPAVLPALELTVTDSMRAATLSPQFGEVAASAAPGLAWVALLAFIGGVILNVMPCVLPVLSIKFTSVLQATGQSLARIRLGFLLSALGVLSFMWVLAAVLLAIRAGGGSIGWGIQFQNPYFLTLMVGIITLFAANMFGLFEIALPQRWNSKLARVGADGGLVGDYLIGAFAAVLATPCSAPFLGTAITVALAGSGLQTITIFTALGIGLALPYLLVALWPKTIHLLPKPGAWMVYVKWVMGALLLATVLWLIWVLGALIGQGGALLLLALMVGLIAACRLPRMRAGLVGAICLAALLVPIVATPPEATARESNWAAFSMEEISAAVQAGQVVFVDVTADWCLSCKANKTLVLDRAPVATWLASDSVTAMQADWTRPDETILAYLKQNGRFGIPFNIIYGPGAPDGIALPELLTPGAVMEASERAAGR